MSQNLTQPEEIDRILRTMAGCDRQAGAPIPTDKQAGMVIGGCERDEPGSGVGSTQRRSPQDPQS